MAMFQQPNRPNGTVHVEFKAGKMTWDGKTVTADKRKGKVILMTHEDDELMHFHWYDREKNETDPGLIVINDAYFEKIEKVKDGRVYILRFTSSNKKLFFWMQEPKEEGDEALIKKFNETVGATIPEKKAGGTAAPSAVGSAQPDFSAILAQMQQQSQMQQAQRGPPIPLPAVLTTEVLQSLMSDEAAVKELQALLPETHQSPEGVREALGSPQLQQSMRSLTQAVYSDQLPLLFSSLGLSPSEIADAGQGADALEVLCKALEKKEKKPDGSA
mmetsp:Transcript_29697/g.44815  ORF Transcript_29697/g.44815 Transcript_29697/m.44815 type:complete len:273 (+) Transcript_29697:91-909(+)